MGDAGGITRDALLEVFAWMGATEAFTSTTGGEVRLGDLGISIAALLVAPRRATSG